jgi:hypothetical protein
MNEREQEPVSRELQVALKRLAADVVVPPADPQREAALLAAFDRAKQVRLSYGRAAYGWMAALATAAALLVMVGIGPGRVGRRDLPSEPDGRTHASVTGSRGVSPGPIVPNDFVPWPGARDLPPFESGELVRVDLPVSMLPTLGMVPPSTRGAAVKADVIVGQDGLARAVRLVSD